MELPMKSLTLEIESKLNHVSLLAVAVHAICVHAGLGREDASQVELSLVEAVTNSIQHAYRGEPDQRLLVILAFDEKHLRFDLYDTGTPMRGEEVDRLVRGSGIHESESLDLASIAESGRGLEIIHRTMDEIVYKREGDRNHLRLIRYVRAE
jgi:serine/threonine-protein kinase RsbW